uniref:Uncharacterized protein n=1 Tax=Ananas comosus var. bracteatus TaxID=296719 RepID=A0A6V7PGG0_ANACO|nr:unnamed protein product [Ananas comosus var. bracteatus]
MAARRRTPLPPLFAMGILLLPVLHPLLSFLAIILTASGLIGHLMPIASCPVAGGHVGPSHVRNGVRLGGLSHVRNGLELLGLMVSTNDPTSGIRARGHGFDSRMLQMCAGTGGGIVGLNRPASCLWREAMLGRVMFEMA